MICHKCDGTKTLYMRCQCNGAGCFVCAGNGGWPERCPTCLGEGVILCGGCGEAVDTMDFIIHGDHFCTKCWKVEYETASGVPALVASLLNPGG